MAQFIDRTGHLYGKLAVLGFSHRDARRVSHWFCECSCGERVTIPGNNLSSGNSKSCGCLHGVRIDNPITREQVIRLVRYVPEVGKLYWLVRGQFYKPGDEAGHFYESTKYVKVIFKKQQYYVHVVAWLIMTGDWPSFEIDHKDTNKANNKWDNLRPATHAQNMWNRGATVNNGSGFKGVRWSDHSARFLARITVNKDVISLGTFDDPVEAARAYDQAALRYHGEFARTNFEVA